MAQQKLEERLASLESEVAQLRSEVVRLTRVKDWRTAAGMFTGDEVMQRIFEEGRKIREADRKQSRRPKAKRKKAGA
jgi:hypothetical protein